MSDKFSFALDLNESAPVSKLVDLLKEAVKDHVVISTNQKEHDVTGSYRNPIFISHYELDDYEDIVLYSLIFKILTKYGSKVKSLHNGKSYYPVYVAPDEYYFIVPNSSYDDENMIDFLFITETGRLLTDDEMDDLEDKRDEIEDESEDEKLMEPYTFCDYLPITDSPDYLEEKPSFITYFWKKRKEAYEKISKKAFDDLIHLLPKV
jgi:hypothetical protein